MRLTIEPTQDRVFMAGSSFRLWLGTTPKGNPVEVFVHGVGTYDRNAQEELDEAARAGAVIDAPVPIMRVTEVPTSVVALLPFIRSRLMACLPGSRHTPASALGALVVWLGLCNRDGFRELLREAQRFQAACG